MTVSHGPQGLHAQAADRGGRQEEAGRRRGFRTPRSDIIRPAADSIDTQPSRGTLALIPKGRGIRTMTTSSNARRKFSQTVDLTNAVQSALQFYVRDVMFLSDVPQCRRRLKALQDNVTRFLASLPQEHDPVGYFLRRTYTGEIFLKGQLRPTDEKFVELEQAWSGKHGLVAIRNSLAEFQENIDAARSLLSGTRPRDVAKENFVRSLAHAWKAATGRWPKSGRDDYKIVVNPAPSPISFGR